MKRCPECDRAIIDLLNIVDAHIDNGDFDRARDTIEQTEATLRGLKAYLQIKEEVA